MLVALGDLAPLEHSLITCTNCFIKFSNSYLVLISFLTEELADALLAEDLRKSGVTSIQTQAQVHSPVRSSEAGVQASHLAGPVTSTPRSGVSTGSGDSGIGDGSGEGSGVNVEKIEHQLALTTQELMETKEALDKSEKTILELKERAEVGGKAC